MVASRFQRTARERAQAPMHKHFLSFCLCHMAKASLDSTDREISFAFMWRAVKSLCQGACLQRWDESWLFVQSNTMLILSSPPSLTWLCLDYKWTHSSSAHCPPQLDYSLSFSEWKTDREWLRERERMRVREGLSLDYGLLFLVYELLLLVKFAQLIQSVLVRGR